MKTPFKHNLFTILTIFLVIILPFYVLIKVFFEYKLGIPKFGFFIKEFVIVILFISMIYEFFKAKKLPKFEILDYLFFWYFIYWVIITIVNWLWLNSIIYWARYDYMFFVVFLIFRHSKQFLQVKINELLKLFIYSASVSIFLSILIKFRIWEDALLLFWFTDYISNWTYNWSIPTYHWLENSWIKRFQWIYDWPSAMWFFLILYSYIFVYLQKKKSEFYVFFVWALLLVLLFLTYSRSALLWVGTSIWILFLLNFKKVYKYYKTHFIYIIIFWIIFVWTFWIIYKEKISNIIFRSSSTTGHFDRMEIWIDRFLEKPFWSWLAESGPAYRSIYPDKQTKEDEQYYIPESWFVQQLTEWWFIYFLLFLSIFWIILRKLFIRSKTIFALLIAILVMNIFLHVFEATYLSILLFIFIWLFCSKKYD